MRLDSQEIQTMRTAVETIVGNSSEIRVFGSRLDDSKRGGDLDLLIESDMADGLIPSDLKWSLEEKLALPVDIIFLQKGKKRSAFQELAYSRSGILR
jgi:predicted nucleotidyltransferase